MKLLIKLVIPISPQFHIMLNSATKVKERHCATSQKIVGSILDVIEFFHCLILPAAICPRADKSSDRNEY
jgi:hypothetical protein